MESSSITWPRRHTPERTFANKAPLLSIYFSCGSEKGFHVSAQSPRAKGETGPSSASTSPAAGNDALGSSPATCAAAPGPLRTPHPEPRESTVASWRAERRAPAPRLHLTFLPQLKTRQNTLRRGWHFTARRFSKKGGFSNLLRLGHRLHSLCLCSRKSGALKVRSVMGARHCNSFKTYP